ncbi:unnamed protein product [Schistocephalus solidus]|uniref:EF-hand domain-containing protein n=1 Tax=Schistocephalus solidus TaxID=70667 RepID=A0A183SDY3_SCHSO|nr:unnamed protein product [Schistocephalus solidus]
MESEDVIKQFEDVDSGRQGYITRTQLERYAFKHGLGTDMVEHTYQSGAQRKTIEEKAQVQETDSMSGFDLLHEKPVDSELVNRIVQLIRQHEDPTLEEMDLAKRIKEDMEKWSKQHWQVIVATGHDLGCAVGNIPDTFVFLRKASRVYILYRTPIY